MAVCDIAVAAGDAVFAFSEVRLGILPAVISPFVMRKIGPGAARDLFLTGNRFDAVRAREIGLVQRTVPAADLDAEVDAVVASLAAGGPAAQTRIKRPDQRDRRPSPVPLPARSPPGPSPPPGSRPRGRRACGRSWSAGTPAWKKES